MADQEMIFDAAPVKQDTPVSQSAPAAQDSSMTFDSSPVKQDTPANEITDQLKGASSEERDFLAKNPAHAWMPADPKFPNRPEGIYPTGKGNEWRNDPDVEQHPIDLHFVKHTLQGAAEGALAAASAPAFGALAEALPSVVPATIEGVKAVGAWATAHPLHAYVLYNTLKDMLPGFKKAVGIIKAAPVE
jgi:hypothetical protein